MKLRLDYVLAVSCDHLVPINAGSTRRRADRLAAGLPATAWTRRSAGDGSKGQRFYDWAWLGEVGADGDPTTTTAGDAAIKHEPNERTTPAASASNSSHDHEWRLSY